jgi:hypothetical protein
MLFVLDPLSRSLQDFDLTYWTHAREADDAHNVKKDVCCSAEVLPPIALVLQIDQETFTLLP